MSHNTELVGTIDAVWWAGEFRRTAINLGYSDMDEDWLIGWFANAIMTGYDHAKGTHPVRLPDGSGFAIG